MGETFASALYRSRDWKKCRAAFIKRQGGLCERCYAKGLIVPGVIVHHKIHITPQTLNDPSVVFNFDNLELLCRDCHEKEHGRMKSRYKVDDFGKIIITE